MNWISVKDKLPELKQRVIVFLDAETAVLAEVGGKRVLVEAVNFVADANGGNNQKPYAWEEGPMKHFGQNVTHWMPIPEPPGA